MFWMHILPQSSGMTSKTKKMKSLYGYRGGTAGNDSLVLPKTPFPVSIPNIRSRSPLHSGVAQTSPMIFHFHLLFCYSCSPFLPAQLLSSAQNKVHNLNLYLFHFPQLYPPTKRTPISRTMHGNLQRRKQFFIPLKRSSPLPLLSSYFLSHSHSLSCLLQAWKRGRIFLLKAGILL